MVNEAEAVYEIFSHTKYGRLLNKSARYNRFRPSGYSVKKWGRLLGPDVNNLQHMRHSISVARWFVKTENTLRKNRYSASDALLLGITAALHDQAESVIGDIPYGKKSRKQRKNEIKILQEHESGFEPRLNRVTLQLYRKGRDKIAFGDTSRKLPGAFKTIEFIGFVENALSALRRLEQLQKSTTSKTDKTYFDIQGHNGREEIVIALERLSAEVLGSGVIEQLIDYGKRFPSAHIYLRRNSTQIQLGFDCTRQDIFQWYESEDPFASQGERKRRINGFRRQKRLWENWTK